MKIRLLSIIGLLFFSLVNTVSAQHSNQHFTSPPKNDQSKQTGKLIAEKQNHGLTFSFYLLSREERKEMLKGHEDMEMAGISKSPDVTHHLMLFIKGGNGTPVEGKVGFNIIDPNGKSFKTLTMGMYNGYGADVFFSSKGKYKIITKAVTGHKTITDEILFEVE
ncbi:hypothetical protein KKA14_09090 [bacterium]|nr:hypothetical protein [bacterium]